MNFIGLVFVFTLFYGKYAMVYATKPSGHSNVYRSQDTWGNYGFKYDIHDPWGAKMYQKEKGDPWGRKWGSYGLIDNNGQKRIVTYVADEHGFRAHISSNEPGVSSKDSADALVNGPDHGSGYGLQHHKGKGWGHETHDYPTHKGPINLKFKKHSPHHDDWSNIYNHGHNGWNSMNHLGYGHPEQNHHDFGYLNDNYGHSIDHGWRHGKGIPTDGWYLDNHNPWASTQIFSQAKPDRL